MKIAGTDGCALEAEVRMVPGAPAAVVCHPHPAFGGRMDTPLVVALAESLERAGLSTVRFNFRGLGGSQGQPTGGVTEHEDVAAVVAWAAAQGAPRVALVGYSFGALMAARALAEGAPAALFVAIGFPTTLLDQERVAYVERALELGVPWLFVNGDADQFCETERLHAWVCGRPWTRMEVLSGRGHFFDGEEAFDLCRRVSRFVAAAL